MDSIVFSKLVYIQLESSESVTVTIPTSNFRLSATFEL